MSEQNPQPPDHADALRALAETSQADEQRAAAARPKDQSEALAAMADGQDLVAPAEAAAADADADTEVEQTIDEELLAAAGVPEGPGVDPADLADLPVGEEGKAVRAARTAALDQQRSRVHAHQFKQVMVPLLLTVGGLLLVLGIVVAAMLPPRGASGGLLSRSAAIWAVVAAFPLAAILLFGAWFFRRELREARKS